MKKISEHRETITLFSDASFSKEHGLAVLGSGFMSDSESERENGSPENFETAFQVGLTTISEKNNIRAEIRAALFGLSRCSQGSKVILYTDCKAVSELPGRRKNLEGKNFRSLSKNDSLANADLYKGFFKVFDALDLEIVWVKGHSKSHQRSATEHIFSKLDTAVRRELRKTVAGL